MMSIDVLVLNSGEWALSEELSALPWHILIYRDRLEVRNELHLWLPHHGRAGSEKYAFRRYWVDGHTRWCVELPPHPDGFRWFHADEARPLLIRFTAPDGHVLWSPYQGSKGSADLTDAELKRIRLRARPGPFSRI